MAKSPGWGTIAVGGLVLLLTVGQLFDPESAVPIWLAVAQLVVGMAAVTRLSKTELRIFPTHIRVVGFWRTTDIDLDDIIGILPEETKPGHLRLQARGVVRPVLIIVSPRFGAAREKLRKRISENIDRALELRDG